jgi:hypothetical protein
VALVDHEAVVQRLKEFATTKTSHGQRDLLSTIARFEAECAVDEAPVERNLRLVVAAIRDRLWPAPDRSRVSGPDGLDDSRPAGADSTVRQEDTHEHHHSRGPDQRVRAAA